MWASTMYRMTALIAAGANFVSEGEGKFLHQLEGSARKKPTSGDAGFDMTQKLPYHAATGFPGEPVAPTSLSGAQANRNS